MASDFFEPVDPTREKVALPRLLRRIAGNLERLADRGLIAHRQDAELLRRDAASIRRAADQLAAAPVTAPLAGSSADHADS